MKHNILPPSPFQAGTTYDAYGSRIDNPKVSVATRRELGVHAFRDNGGLPPLGSGYLQAVHEQTTRRIQDDHNAIDGEQDSSRENLDQARLEVLFAFPDPSGVDRLGNSFRNRTEVTDQSEADAALAYRLSDDDVKEIVQPYKTSEFWREEQMPALIRGNNDLRIALGTSFLQKFTEMDADFNNSPTLPRSLWKNVDKLKNPDFKGYALDLPGGTSLTPREYASMLAVAMLDGTYKKNFKRGMEVQYSPRNGEINQGQFRVGAEILLQLRRDWPKK